MVPMSAGNVLLFKSNLIHCSPSNLSKDTRVAIRIEVVPAGRVKILYYQDNQSVNEIEVYEIPRNFFTTYRKWDRPKDVELLKRFKYTSPAFSRKLLRSYLN